MFSYFTKKIKELTKDKNFSEILAGSVLSLSGRIVAACFGLVSNIIIARFYGAESLGIFALVNSFLMFTALFTLSGTGTSILKLIPEHIAKYSIESAFYIYRKIHCFILFFSACIGLFLFFASDIIAKHIFLKPQLSFYLALAACFVVFKSLADFNTQAIRGLRLINTYAFMQILPSFVMIASILTLTMFSTHIGNPVYAQLTTFFVVALVGGIIMNRSFKNKINNSGNVEIVPFKEIFCLSLPMLMTGSMHFFIGQTGIILLGIFRPESDVGLYSAAVKLATLTSFVLQAVNSMVAPKFSELFHKQKIDDLFQIAKKSAKLIFWSTFPVLVILLLAGKSILALLFSTEFVTAYPALIILVIGQFVNSISGSTGLFMNMTGHQNTYSKIIFFSTLLNFVLNFVLIPKFGIIGSAVANAISLVSWNFGLIYFIKTKFGKTVGYLPFPFNTAFFRRLP